MQGKLVVAIGLAVFVCTVAATHAEVTDAAKCQEAKAKASGKKAFDILKAFGKNQKRPNAGRLSSDVSKAQSKFTKGFAKAEHRGGCPTSDDSAAIEAKVDAMIADLVGAITDPCCATQLGAIGLATIDYQGSEVCGQMRNYRCTIFQCSGSGAKCRDDSECPSGETCDEGDSSFRDHVCVDDGDESECDFGTCIEFTRCSDPPHSFCIDNSQCVGQGTCIDWHLCSGDFGTASYPGQGISCTQNSDCAGWCEERTGAGFPQDLRCGGLYTGGGLNSVPLPLAVPDMGVTVHAVTSCEDGILQLGPTSQESIGPNYGPDGQGLQCTEGKKCDEGISPNPGGRDGNGLCRVEDDCGCVLGDGCCLERCLLGPPLPIPNSTTVPTSMCVRNVIAKDTSGTVNCNGGETDVLLSIAAVVHVTGDLLNKWTPPDVPGIQSCPICTKVCVGGDDAGYPCLDDSECDSNDCSESEQCVGRGPRENLPCTPQTSRVDIHKCCDGGSNNTQRCDDHADCAPPPGPAPRCELSFDPCTDDSDCTAFPGDSCIKCVEGCTSFPTSHDCPPDPGQDITLRIGGLPIDFTLTSGRRELNAIDVKDTAQQRRVFCGYCRDIDYPSGSLCFEGDTDPDCPTAIPEADGNAVPCVTDADCQADVCLGGSNERNPCTDDSDCPGGSCVADTDAYTNCGQHNPGAFSRAAATTFWATGETDGEWLSDGECHRGKLTGVFCTPPTFDHTIDSAADLPGPGVSNLVGDILLSGSPSELDPGASGTFCP